MGKIYECPHCGAILNPGEKIILTVAKAGKKAMVLLSPVLGDYSSEIPENFHPVISELIDFLCPVCHHDLTSSNDATFAEIRFREGPHSGKVAFSKKYGRQITLVLNQNNIVDVFGKDKEGIDVVNFSKPFQTDAEVQTRLHIGENGLS